MVLLRQIFDSLSNESIIYEYGQVSKNEPKANVNCLWHIVMVHSKNHNSLDSQIYITRVFIDKDPGWQICRFRLGQNMNNAVCIPVLGGPATWASHSDWIFVGPHGPPILPCNKAMFRSSMIEFRYLWLLLDIYVDFDWSIGVNGALGHGVLEPDVRN